MNIIAIDCGASFIKAGLISDGNLIKEIKKSTPNVIEDIFDHSHILSQISILKEILDELTKYGDEFYISISNEMHGFILFDTEINKPIIDYISWQKEFGTKSIGNSKDTIIDVLNSNRYKDDILRTGMPVRAGLPSCNLYYLISNDLIDIENKSIRFFTLGDFIIYYIFKVVPKIHPTNAAATGLYDVYNNDWNSKLLSLIGAADLIFPEIGTSIQTCEYNQKLIHVLSAIGDQQAALLGAGICDTKGISFNLGTGAQISLLMDHIELCDKYQTRPFFANKFLKTIPHIPSGRALNVYIRFIKSVFSAFEISISDQEIWNKVLLIANNDHYGNSSMKCDLSFFSNAITDKTKGGIYEIGEYDFSLDEIISKVFSQIIENFIDIAEKLIDEDQELEYIVFSGGIAKRIDIIRKGILNRFNNLRCLDMVDNETLWGIYKYILLSLRSD